MVNDVFKPMVNGIDIQQYELKIFDRWGGLVFVTNNPEMGWDGGNYSQDNYFYKIKSKKLDGTTKEFIGTITLIK
jgi:gliding motility-associated-like protein